mmetsp:Transcript_18229/g.52353  ORF Transcript_18229/g.52353 Transcript_18229/m.52353 type:complete len:310 (+) Transcript_18229:92-1021(+)
MALARTGAAAPRRDDGAAMAAVLNPVRGFRDAQRRAGVMPVDHARRNLLALRETERRLQEERENRERRVPREPFKIKKFQGVQSRVSRRVEEDNTQRPVANRHAFLRKGERCRAPAPAPAGNRQRSPREQPPSPGSAAPPSARSGRIHASSKPAVPKPTDLNHLAPRESKNFVQNNAREVIERAAKNKELSEAQRNKERQATAKHANYGHVPQYLIRRQGELLAEKTRKMELTNPECPPGMVLVPETERLKTLDSLKATAEGLRNELRRFPLAVTTVTQRQRKHDLEKKLEEQESAIEIFSKDKVYIYE